MSTYKTERKLLVVEAVFPITGQGTVVEPGPSFDTFGATKAAHSCAVKIVRPDGSELIAQAHFHVAHANPWQAQLRYIEHGCYTCLFRDLTPSDVPVGSAIYEY